jgi:hypothetical protein
MTLLALLGLVRPVRNVDKDDISRSGQTCSPTRAIIANDFAFLGVRDCISVVSVCLLYGMLVSELTVEEVALLRDMNHAF